MYLTVCFNWCFCWTTVVQLYRSIACLVVHEVVLGLASAKNVVWVKEFGSACNQEISVNLEQCDLPTKCVCPLTALLHLLKLSPSKILSASAAE